MRRHAYELFLRTHLILSAILGAAIWIHVWTPQGLIKILLITASGCFVGSFLYRWCVQLYRNISPSNLGFIRIATASRVDDGLMLELRLSRPWIIEPGHYIYLTLLTTGALSLVQRHPFVITWWKNDINPGSVYSNIVNIMIAPRNGWSRRIVEHTGSLHDTRSWLDGPYAGLRYDLHQYGCVLLFASGTGMFAILPFVKHLIKLTQDSAANTRRIKLVWHTDQKQAITQIATWMQDLLDITVQDKSASTLYAIHSLLTAVVDT